MPPVSLCLSINIDLRWSYFSHTWRKRWRNQSTASYFLPSYKRAGETAVDVGFLVGAEIERARLKSENTPLTSRLETRKAVDRAKSVLQRDLSLNEEDAYQLMQKKSRQRRKSMREIADAILLAEDLRRTR